MSLQANTSQIRARILQELTQKKLIHESSPTKPSSQKPNFQNVDQSSDSDFEDKPKAGSKRKWTTKWERDVRSPTKSEDTNKPLTWENLPADIQSVLPNGEEYSYIIQSHHKKDAESFEGAPELAFSAIIRINLETPEAVATWLNKMMATSLCTYRVTRGGHKTKGKRADQE